MAHCAEEGKVRGQGARSGPRWRAMIYAAMCFRVADSQPAGVIGRLADLGDRQHTAAIPAKGRRESPDWTPHGAGIRQGG